MSEPTGRGAGFEHEPVLLDEVVAVIEPVPAGRMVDATVGGGGHAAAVLRARPDLRLLGLDRDPAAVAAATERLAEFGDRARVVHARFDRLTDAVSDLDPLPVTAVLFDLGVSSPQLGEAARGFSYRVDGPLDMRMDPSAARTAADLVNGASEAELTDVIRRFGDERYAARIARAVVAARPIVGTVALAEVVRDAVPAAARRRGGHPATRTFQALRIAVNEELTVLPEAIDAALELLAPAGRCAAITYHSGEDRVVKRRFAGAARGPRVPGDLPVRETPTGPFRPVGRRSVRPGAEELARNPRARSARLRAVERRPDPAGGTP